MPAEPDGGFPYATVGRGHDPAEQVTISEVLNRGKILQICHPERAERVEGSTHRFDLERFVGAKISRLHFVPLEMTYLGTAASCEGLSPIGASAGS